MELKKYCDKTDMGFISSPFDLENIAKTERKVIMSTGMCNMKEILDAIDVLENNRTKEIVL